MRPNIQRLLWVKSGKARSEHIPSGLLTRADVVDAFWHFWFVPLTDIDLLFDHLVSEGEKRRRHGEAKHPGRLGIDDKLELGRLHDRQVRWLGALEDAASVDADLTIGIPQARSVAHQPASFGILAQTRRRGDPVERRQKGQLDASGGERRADADEESVGPFARKRWKAASISRPLLALRTRICSPVA